MTPEEVRRIQAEARKKGMTPDEYLDWKIDEARAEVERLQAEANKLDAAERRIRSEGSAEFDAILDGTEAEPGTLDDLRKSGQEFFDPDNNLG